MTTHGTMTIWIRDEEIETISFYLPKWRKTEDFKTNVTRHEQYIYILKIAIRVKHIQAIDQANFNFETTVQYSSDEIARPFQHFKNKQ